MNKKEKASSLFTSGLNCSQSVLSTFGPALGLPEDMCKKIGRPFGAGMGYMQKTCGAVTGAYMVMGLVHGEFDPGDEKSKEKLFTIMKIFNEKFMARHRSLSCRDLLDCDITTQQGLEKARKENIFHTKCPVYVESAAEILEEIL